MRVKKILHQGFLSLKMECMSHLSLEAYGLLISMVNCPECDYITPEEFQQTNPASTAKTIEAAMAELVAAGYVFAMDDGTYAINKIKICTDMFLVEPNVQKNDNVRSELNG